MSLVEINGLMVDRGGRRIVDGLTLSVAPGQVYALLGGNGSGKSTTVAAVLGLLPRSGGTILVGGEDPARAPDAVRRAIAYLPENVALYDHLSARENVRYFLDIAGIRPAATEIGAAFDAVRLDPAAWDRRAGAFSKGMRQKTAIALALLRRAPLLLLDEPTSGLDPKAAEDFHALVEDLGRRGIGVLMVTHDLLGAADVADRIGLIRDGRIAAQWDAADNGNGGARFDLQTLYRAFQGAA